ncbi:hypothetical protein EAH78_14695 [Pseudomonas arsenicoxydans]|uniref:Uncharacterized protein n=1 Tax=Pseudomonas arsenicoxydans TaxID=702115 RepID=A0A502HRQ0_9PSED|nr:hypothetical protein EAH78_14695 [Pseudomonas arsenicoxydans]
MAERHGIRPGQTDRVAPFASKPAPTLDQVASGLRDQMWERACSRRRPHWRQKFRNPQTQ